MSYMNQNAFASVGGIQDLSPAEIDLILGGRGEWKDLGPMVAGGMIGGAISGAIAGSPGGVHGAGLGATAGAIGGGAAAVITWVLTPTKKK
jgi:hypothetical protein